MLVIVSINVKWNYDFVFRSLPDVKLVTMFLCFLSFLSNFLSLLYYFIEEDFKFSKLYLASQRMNGWSWSMNLVLNYL
jgi:hypothetical protein